MHAPSEFQLSLSHFTGPFTLLPLLVKKQEVDIQHVSLRDVLVQFFSYLDKRQGQHAINSLDTHCIPHITWLHKHKSTFLLQEYLPPSEDFHSEEDSYDPSECIEYLKDYATIRTYTGNLKFLEEQQKNSSYRPSLSQEDSIRPTKTCSFEELQLAFHRILDERKEQLYAVEKESCTLVYACQELKLLLQKEPVSFFAFFRRTDLSRRSLVVFFLALLELLKQGQLLLNKQQHDIMMCICPNER